MSIKYLKHEKLINFFFFFITRFFAISRFYFSVCKGFKNNNNMQNMWAISSQTSPDWPDAAGSATFDTVVLITELTLTFTKEDQKAGKIAMAFRGAISIGKHTSTCLLSLPRHLLATHDVFSSNPFHKSSAYPYSQTGMATTLLSDFARRSRSLYFGTFLAFLDFL